LVQSLVVPPTAQSLQGIPLPRFPAHVDRRVYVLDWDMDADHRAGMAHLAADEFEVSAWPRPVSGGDSHFPLLAHWRRGCRSHRAAPGFARFAVSPNVLGHR